MFSLKVKCIKIPVKESSFDVSVCYVYPLSSFLFSVDETFFKANRLMLSP